MLILNSDSTQVIKLGTGLTILVVRRPNGSVKLDLVTPLAIRDQRGEYEQPALPSLLESSAV